MGSYFGLFKMTFKGELQYRAKAISGVSTQLFWGLMYVYLYTAFMGGKVIEGFSIPQMASYIWLGQMFFALRYMDLPQGCGKEIENGNVCYKFVKPLDLYSQWYCEHLGYKISSTLLRFLPIALIAFLLPNNIGLMLPTSPIAFILFLVALMLGAFLTSALSMIGVFLTFKTLSPTGIRNIMNVVMGILGGTLIPLPLMPQSLQNILNFLPFRYVSDLAARIYIGNISITQSLMYILIGFAWLIVLVLFGKFLILKASKKAIVQGG